MFSRFLFDQSHPAFDKYQNLLKRYKEKNHSLEIEKQGKRKRKNRWDEEAPSASADSQPGSSSSDPVDIMAEFERAKALIQQKAAAAKGSAGISSVDFERQKQIETQQEVCGFNNF